MALIQDDAGSVADGGTVAFSTNVAADNLLIAIVSFGDATTSVVGITDTLGNSWALAIRQAAATKGIEIWYAANPTAGANTLTCDWSATATAQVSIAEFDGFTGGVLVDQTAVGANDTTSPQLAGTITTTKAVSTAIAGLRFSSNFSVTSWSDSFTGLTVGLNRLAAAYLITSSQPLTLPPAATCAANEDTIGVVANFYQAPLSKDVGNESLKIADTVEARLNPQPVLVNQEAARLADTVTAEIPLPVVLPDDVLRLADTLTASMDLVAEASETLKVADNLSADIPAEGLNASLTESLRIIDLNQGHAKISGRIRIQDGPVVAAIDLVVSVADETILLADSVAADENPRDVSAGTETLKLADTLVAVRDLSVPAGDAEALRLADTVASVLDPLATSQTENLKIAYSLTATEDPLEAAPPAEAGKLADTIAAVINLGVDASTEAFKIVDVATTLLDPEQASPSESLVVVDAIAASRADEGTLEATPSESLRITDTLTATEDPLQASVQEDGRLADTLSAARGLDAELAEALRIADTLAAARDLTAELAEALRCTDTVQASRDLDVALAEAMRVRDDADLQAILVAAGEVYATEALYLADALSAELTTLVVEVGSEALRLTDAASSAERILRAVSSIHFTDETLSGPTFNDEAMSGATFNDEALSGALFNDETLAP